MVYIPTYNYGAPSYRCRLFSEAVAFGTLKTSLQLTEISKLVSLGYLEDHTPLLLLLPFCTFGAAHWTFCLGYFSG